jgi:hypothetical protein
LSSRRSSGTVSAMSWPVPAADPLICGGTPGQPVRWFWPRPPAWERVGPQPRSRWSALWTNDLDRGEDRRRLAAADEAQLLGIRVDGGSRPAGPAKCGQGCGARAPSLISVHAAVGEGAGCGDMMIDGVSRQGVRPLGLLRPVTLESVVAGGRQEQAAGIGGWAGARISTRVRPRAVRRGRGPHRRERAECGAPGG